MSWEIMDSTSVETQTWYLMADSGHIGIAQIIYSNVAYEHTILCPRAFTNKLFLFQVAFVQPYNLPAKYSTPMPPKKTSGPRTS